MKHLVIHVPEHVERGELIKQELSDKISWEFFDAVEYKNLIDSDTNEKLEHTFIHYHGDSGDRVLKESNILDTKTGNTYRYIPSNNLETIYKPYNPFLSEKEISLALSHINAIKYFFENNSDDYFVLCEDDIKLNPNYDPNEFYFHLLNLDFDLAVLCQSPANMFKLPCANQITDTFYEVSSHWYSGSAAYCIKRSCYDIIKDMGIVSFTADDLFGILQLDCECKVVSSMPFLFLLNELSKNSTISC